MGANPIPMPKKKAGFVSRKQIELDITNYLHINGFTNANSIARSTISDFKKYIISQNLHGVILNASQKGLEQFKTQELGLWLCESKGNLKEFKSKNCPFSKPICIEPLPPITVMIGQVVATGASNHDELLEELRYLTTELLACQKKLHDTQQELQTFKQRDAAIRLKKSIAGKKGGRGKEL
jgi:hypothetical protein